MFSDRTPESFVPNDWARRLEQLRGSGELLADLTVFDPTRTGLAPGAGAAAALAAAGVPEFEPEALGSAPGRAAVARALAADGLPVEPSTIALTPSTSESYAHLFRLFCSCGESVAAPLPAYPLFGPIADAEGVRLRHYRVVWDGDWHLDRESLVRALDGARALITVEPAFPTGAVLGPDDRAWLASECAARRVPIVADEVFRTPTTPGSSWAAGEPGTLVVALGGLSKTCGLPQLKLAWAVFAGPRPLREQALQRFGWLEDLFLGVASPVQRALPELLELRHVFRAAVAARLAANDRLLREWCAARPEASRVSAGESWAQPLRLPGRRSGDAWALAALEHGVAVHSGDAFELSPGSHVVLSRLVPGDVMSRALAGLARTLDAQPA